MTAQHTPQYEKPFCVGIVVNKSGITFCNVTPVKQCLWRLIVLKVEVTMVSRREKVRTKVRMTATRRVGAKASQRTRVENVSPVGTTTATTKAEERHRKDCQITPVFLLLLGTIFTSCSATKGLTASMAETKENERCLAGQIEITFQNQPLADIYLFKTWRHAPKDWKKPLLKQRLSHASPESGHSKEPDP